MNKTEKKEKYVVLIKGDEKRTKEICEMISRLNSEILKLKNLLKDPPIKVEYRNYQ